MKKRENIRYCECGCGIKINKFDKQGKERRFVSGHQNIGRKRSKEYRKNMSKSLMGRIFSDEHKYKLSDAWKDREVSDETRLKMSVVALNRSDKTRQRMSEAQKGRKHSEETKRKISRANTGRVFSKESIRLMSEAKLNMSDETKRKMSESAKVKEFSEEHRRKIGLAHKGKKNVNWKGGISFGPYCPKFNYKVKEEVRDNFGRFCFECGISEENLSQKLDVHHVDFNKEQGCNDHKWVLIPLCRSCHAKTIFNRKRSEQHYRSILKWWVK